MNRRVTASLFAVAVVFLAGCEAAAIGSAGGRDGDGTFLVGKDIEAGTYQTDGVGDMCYADTTDANGRIINQTVQHGRVTFVIDPAAKLFKTTGCGTWEKADLSTANDPSTFDDGSYLVGVDVQPGTYQTKGVGDLCYADTESETGEILDQEVQYGTVTFVIHPDAYTFESSGCGTWTKV